MRHWLFKILFPKDYAHLRHLIDDVIELEREKAELEAKIALITKPDYSVEYITGSNDRIHIEVV